MIKLAFLSLILYATLAQTRPLDKPCSSSRSVMVYLVSHLPPNPEVKLDVQCVTMELYLGRTQLSPNQEVHFDFCVKPSDFVLSCDLQWGLYYKSFDLFNAKQLGGPCNQGKCIWSAEADGLHLAGNLVYPWVHY